MNDKNRPDVDAAYSLESPDDNVRLYSQWADTYDTDFVSEKHYLQFKTVSDALLAMREHIRGPVLDVGCGTGVVGAYLRDAGIDVVDGIDISEEMLKVAAAKKTGNGERAYRRLLRADLTQTIDIDDHAYGGWASAGTFTHGHLGPDSLNELWRVSAPGAACAFTVRSTHFESAGFAAKLADDAASGVITEPTLSEIRVYAEDTPDHAHAEDTAVMVVCQIR